MKIAHADPDRWYTSSSGHRDGKIDFLPLLQGTDGDPNNYSVNIGRIDVGFESPRHRHNFDQIRVSLQGTTSIGRGHDIAEGEIAYFPEGVFYGPQAQKEIGAASLCMVIQFGGASGSGYMSFAQMGRGSKELAEQGTFEGGVYRAATDGDGGGDAGRGRPRDGYEAIWAHVNGRPLRYPAPRYDAPIRMLPDAYEWTPLDDDAPGVEKKHLGSFTDREIRLELLRWQDGASHRLAAHRAVRLGFVRAGSAATADGQRLQAWSAFELPAGESTRIDATSAFELLLVSLPVLPGA